MVLYVVVSDDHGDDDDDFFLLLCKLHILTWPAHTKYYIMFEVSYFPLTSYFIGPDQLTKSSENSLALPKVFSAIFVCKRFDIAFFCSFFLSLLCKESPYAIFTLHSNIHFSPVSLIFSLVIWLNQLYCQ